MRHLQRAPEQRTSVGDGNRQPSSRAEDTVHLAQADLGTLDVFKDAGAHDALEVRPGKGQGIDVGQQRFVQSLPERVLASMALRERDHCRSKIRRLNRGPSLRQPAREEPRAASCIQPQAMQVMTG